MHACACACACVASNPTARALGTRVACRRVAFMVDVEMQLLSVCILLAWFRLLEFLVVFETFSRMIVVINQVACAHNPESGPASLWRAGHLPSQLLYDPAGAHPRRLRLRAVSTCADSIPSHSVAKAPANAAPQIRGLRLPWGS